MPKGYVIFTESIKDETGMAAYTRLAGPTIVESGATVLAVTRPELLEGEWHGERTVVLEFPTVEAARAWYDSEGYRRARPLRQAAADTNAVLIPGFTARR